MALRVEDKAAPDVRAGTERIVTPGLQARHYTI